MEQPKKNTEKIIEARINIPLTRLSLAVSTNSFGIRGTPYLFIVDYKLQLSYERLCQE